MALQTRCWQWLGLVLGMLLVTAGCSPLTALYFLAPGTDDGIAPECKLTAPDKEVKVLVLAYSGLETRPEFYRADRELGNMLVQKLQKTFQEKKEKVVLMPINRVEKYKDTHPNWQSLGPKEVGQYFGADYVISIEIESLSLYEPGSRNTLFRGNAEITVDVTDLHKDDDGPIFRKPYTCEYPKSRGPLPVDNSGSSVQQFRQSFLDRVATELSWFFIHHPYEDHFKCD